MATSQVFAKIEQIARMDVYGMKHTVIAVKMHMSYGGLCRILACPEYKHIFERVKREQASRMDATLAKRAQMDEVVDGELQEAVPQAMRVILEKAIKHKDLRAALAVVKDLDPQKRYVQTKQNTDPNDPGVGMDGELLQKLVKDADITHTILEKPIPPTVGHSTAPVQAKGDA